MTYRLMISLVVALCIFPMSLAAAELEYSGTVGLGYWGLNESGDSAKAQEYRDKDSSAIGFIDARANKGGYYLYLDAGKTAEFGGGRFGKFKYDLSYEKLDHRISEDARSYFWGIDSNVLVDSGNQADPTLWTTLDYHIEHETFGINTEWSFNTPFYVEIGAAHRKSDGRVPYGSASDTILNTIELPAPVDWTTDTAYLGTGYRTKNLVISLRGEVSEFDNDNDVLYWDGDTGPGILDQATSLAPDSDYWKVSGQMVWRLDFWSSSLALRGSYSEADNSLDLYKIEALGPAKFDGEVDNTSINAAYNFAPTDALDAKIYLNYFDHENDNQILTDIDGNTNTPDEYDRMVAGFEFSYDLPARTTLDTGYAYTDTDLDGRSDSDGAEDSEVFVQLRNRSFNDVQLRAKFAYLDRDGDPNKDNTDVLNGVRSYDYADQEKTTVELAVTAMVTDNLGLGVEGAWSDIDYDDTTFGLTDVEHYDVYLSADYAQPEMFSSSVYFGYEYDETDMTSETSGGYKEQKEYDTYAYGINVEVPLSEVLKVNVMWDHSWVDGEADFNRDDLVGFDEVEDYSLKTFELNCNYNFSEAIAFTVGYIYEKYKFDDDQWDGYNYLPGDATLTGAYSDQDYENNIGYFLAKYRF